jgi:predicted esterase
VNLELTMPRSFLTYREFRGDRGADSPLLVILHGRGADDEQFVPLYDSLKPSYDACMVRAPVPVVPPTGYRSKAAERSWYLGEGIHRPEPVSFGNALWQLEQLLRDVRDRVGVKRPVVLAGCDQGAVLCLTMALIARDWLAGVVAIDGGIPAIDGWPLPAGETDELPLLLVYDIRPREATQRLAESTVEEFRRRNAEVEIARVDGLLEKPLATTPVISAWLEKIDG